MSESNSPCGQRSALPTRAHHRNHDPFCRTFWTQLSSTGDHILFLTSGTAPNLRHQTSGGGTVTITSSVAIVNDTTARRSSGPGDQGRLELHVDGFSRASSTRQSSLKCRHPLDPGNTRTGTASCDTNEVGARSRAAQAAGGEAPPSISSLRPFAGHLGPTAYTRLRDGQRGLELVDRLSGSALARSLKS